jgi:hypothetical protein
VQPRVVLIKDARQWRHQDIAKVLEVA